MYRWVESSKDSLAISSLSILGDGHPFIPINSPLRGVFKMDIGSRCRIIAEQIDTSRTFPPQILRTKPGLSPVTWSVAFSPDGCCLASAHDNETVCIWDVTTGWSLQELKRRVLSVAFSPYGRRFASGSNNRAVHVTDAATGALLQRLDRPIAQVYASVNTVAFSADGHRLASSSEDCTVQGWNAATGLPIQELRHDAPVCSVAFSPDSHYLASASRNDAIHVWDVAKGSSVIQKRLQHHNYRPNISFSTDGSVLRVKYCEGPPIHLHFPSLEMIDNPHPSPLYLDKNSLCVKHQGLTLRLCWLPDHFKPTTPVTQHGNRICIGGWGTVAFIDLDELAVPDL